MEERFLKLRQEREEERLSRVGEATDGAVQRRQFEEEAALLTAKAEELLLQKSYDVAQDVINQLRMLVQDTSNNVSLTAHDMAKANGALARLQQAVDDQKCDPTTKKFKFSTRVKSKPTLPPPASTLDSKTSAAPSTTVIAPLQGNTYGPASNMKLFVDTAKAVFLQNCVKCEVYCLPICGSVFISNCSNCRIYVACHQLRMKDCNNVDVYVWAASTPIIEHCDSMRFGPYRCWEGLVRSRRREDPVLLFSHEEWVRIVGGINGAAGTEDNYQQVSDFQWLRKHASPHWRVMEPHELHCSAEEFIEPTPPQQHAM